MMRMSFRTSVEAFIIPGSSGSRAGYSGDSVLLDFGNRLFGLADSSGRSPELSRELLVGLSAVIESINREAGEGDFAAVLRGALDVLIGKFYGSGSSTLTAVMVAGPPEDEQVIMIHTGDSSLVAVNGETGKMEFLSQSNFWMVGKSMKLYQVASVNLGRGDWAIIGSDGLMDLLNAHGSGIEGFCGALASAESAAPMVDEIYRKGVMNPVHDDAGLILMKPRQAARHPEKLIIGGVPRPSSRSAEATGDLNDFYPRGLLSDSILVM